MRYAWIEGHRDAYPTARMCRLLKVSRTGYLQWRTRPMTTEQRLAPHQYHDEFDRPAPWDRRLPPDKYSADGASARAG